MPEQTMDKDQDVILSVDRLINYDDYPLLPGSMAESKFSPRLGRDVPLLALEMKVWEWSKDHPVLWNVGIGPAASASFVPTLTRLLFDRTKELYGPYDQITRVRLPPAEATSSRAAQHQLAFAVLTEMLIHDNSKQLQELKQLATEESYYGYGELSDNLMLQAIGREYIRYLAKVPLDPIYSLQPRFSPILERIIEALEGKRHLLLIENLHVPVSLDMLVLIMGQQWPSVFHNRRWLISATSKDVCEKSIGAQGAAYWTFQLSPKYYYAPRFDDLRVRDWAMLIKEALQDAARTIYMALQDKGYPVEFWLRVAHQCPYYGILYHPLQGVGGAGCQATNTSSVTADVLVLCWVAEDLIFSELQSAFFTNTPAATSQKQSKYYRSAYEAGKVVIQALQEYSLLPLYSAISTTTSSEETTSMSFSHDVITGVSKLAEHVPRLNQDELSTQSKKRKQLRWVSFMNDDGRHVSWDWPPRENIGDIKMTTLVLRGCSSMSIKHIDKLLISYLRVLDLSYTPITSLPPSFSSLLNLYLLSLRGCSQLQTLSPPPPNSKKETSPLAPLENLQVLDMNGVPLTELTQRDGSNKSNLHYLDLSGSKVSTLPSEFFLEMSSLEDLIFGNCTNLRELPPSMAQLSNLLVLHVEGTQITSLPEHIFQAMKCLHALKLIDNMLLMSLPMSLSEASSLDVLHLSNCISLRSLPSSLSNAKCLRELHILKCISLRLQVLWEKLSFLEILYIQTWEGLEDIKILGHPNLRTFSLSGPWIKFLSLRGCSKLKSVNFSDDLIALEGVDISETAIEEVPHNFPNLPQLNKLLLVGVPCFKRFPWHQLVRFPKVFYLDHSANDENQVPEMFCQPKLTNGDENQHKEETSKIVHMNINDPRMFHSFNADAARKLVKEGQFLKSFNVQVRPCMVRSKKPRINEVELCARIQRHSTYHDVQFSEAASIMPMMKFQPKQRHVEISAVNQYPNGLRHILSVTNSIFIADDNFVRCLTDLNYNLNELEECQLKRCHQMKVLFHILSYSPAALPYLQILKVFDLNKLVSVVEQSGSSDPLLLSYPKLITLKLLKHIHMEHCPRLEKMFPCSLSLPALETLVILFCSNLKTIFYKEPTEVPVSPSPLPKIVRIFLQELPQLLHIHDNITFRFGTPKWETLFVWGCKSFHQLPLLKKELPKSKVEVSGEREWWHNLQMQSEQSDYYLHVPPPEFVSHKTHIIQSYLR